METPCVRVASLPGQLPRGDGAPASGALVIDTLRFTTTAAQAIATGARSLRIVQDIAEARRLADSSAAPGPLLCGERHCRPIEGFDLGNSPLEYTLERIAGRDLIFSTTNGTLATQAVGQGGPCWLASLVNRSAVVDRLLQSPTSQWWIVCAGTDGQLAGEDLLAAGAIVDLWNRRLQGGLQLANDAAQVACSWWQSVERQFDAWRIWSSGSQGRDSCGKRAIGRTSCSPARSIGWIGCLVASPSPICSSLVKLHPPEPVKPVADHRCRHGFGLIIGPL